MVAAAVSALGSSSEVSFGVGWRQPPQRAGCPRRLMALPKDGKREVAKPRQPGRGETTRTIAGRGPTVFGFQLRRRAVRVSGTIGCGVASRDYCGRRYRAEPYSI